MDPHDFRVHPKKNLKLRNVPTRLVAEGEHTDETWARRLEESSEKLLSIQGKLIAEKKHSILIVLQGMDTSGKDGAIKHVLSGLNPQGCHVTSFKAPTETDLAHDFLWRVSARLPERGQFGIFNRSHYEDVIVPSVNPEILKKSSIPRALLDSNDFIDGRLEDIRNFEAYLCRQGVVILKFFLHISKEEQKQRLLSRIDDPRKNWKLDESDFVARKKWPAYLKAYSKALRETSTKNAPWYILPADDKKAARWLMSEILVDRLSRVDLSSDRMSEAQHRKVLGWKELL